jgi:hypothetical protein
MDATFAEQAVGTITFLLVLALVGDWIRYRLRSRRRP